MGLFRSNQAVGIDLGYSSIKVVGLALGKRPRVVGFSQVAVEPKSLQKEGLSDLEEASKALKTALSTALPHRITATDAYISLNESAVFRKILEVPKGVSPEDLNSVIRAAVVEYLPDELDTLELDYQPLGTTSDGELQVMVVATSKKTIEQYLALGKAAGLTVRAVDPKPSALVRAVVGPKHAEPLLVVDIGSEMSSAFLVAQGSIWVAGTVNLGGNIVKDPATGAIDETKRVEKLSRLVTGLADELEHVVKFYANRAAGSAPTIREVRIVGGGSIIEGIDTVLQKETGYDVSFARPGVAVPDGCDRRFYAALGSAMYPLYDLL
jgi:type IV pilus assembly protein PilM